MTTREVVLEGGSPWGFRIRGGVDTESPLRISRVNSNGKAALKGIREGDLITSINGQPTKDLRYSDAHSLIKNSEDPLRLELNVDPGSPKQKKRYKATLHETHSETLKSTSSTLYSRNSTKTIFNDENEYADPDQYLRKPASDERQNNFKEHIEPPLSPDSTVSSDVSSCSTLTEAGGNASSYITSIFKSTLQNSPTMADCASSKTKRKRSKNQRRRQRKNAANTHHLPHTDETNSNEIKVEEEYKVDFPEAGASKPKLKIKSKSLDDDDDAVKIQEVEESGEEDKHQCEAIVSEADSDWEETTELRIPQNPVSLSTIAISIDEEPMQRVENFSPEEELTLRNFLEGINLINSPGCQSSVSTLDSIKIEKARKRDALMKYFTPLAHNPRFLDIISEEGSDLSDRESSTLTRHLKEGTPELDNLNQNVSTQNPRFAKRNKLKRLQLKRHEEKAVLVCTKMLDTPSIIEHVHSRASENVEPEKVYLESSSENASSENSSETGVSTPSEHGEQNDANIDVEGLEKDSNLFEESKSIKTCGNATDLIEDDAQSKSSFSEFRSCVTVANEEKLKESTEKSKPTYNSSVDGNYDIPKNIPNNYAELTPPPTPELSPKKKLSTDSIVDLDLDECMKEIVRDTAREITSVLCKLEQAPTTTFIVNQAMMTSPERHGNMESVHSPSRSSSSSRETSPSTVRLNPMTSSIADVASILTDLDIAKEVSSLKQPLSLRQSCLEFLLTSPHGTRLMRELSEASENIEKLAEAGNKTKEKLESAASLNPINMQDINNSNLISEVTEKLKQIMSSKKWTGLPFYNNPNLLLYLSPKQRSELERSDAIMKEPEILYDSHSKFSERVGPNDEKYSTKRRIEITSLEKETMYKTSDTSYSMMTSNTFPRNFKESNSNPRLEVSNLDDWLDIARRSDDKTEKQEHNSSSEKPTEFGSTEKLTSSKRRTSLPDELYRRQLQMILEKEKEIEKELENLLEEKRKLFIEMRNTEETLPENSSAKLRPNSFPQSPSETLRQKMYEEYMRQVAEREERKHHKMIKITSAPQNKNNESDKPQFEAIHLPGIEDEFMKRVQERHGPLEKVEEETMKKDEIIEESSTKTSHVLLIDGKSVKEATDLPKHLREFVEITADDSSKETIPDSTNGIWSPGQKQEIIQAEYDKQKHRQQNEESIPSIWQPKSATSSPVAERKEFRPVSFESPKLGRKNKSQEFQDNKSFEKSTSRPWQDSVPRGELPQSSTLERRIPNSKSAPATGINEFTIGRLPRAQNPTVTLLQKAREGQLPKGAHYLEANRDHYRVPHDFSDQGEIIHPRRNDHYSESDSEIFQKSNRQKVDGVGPLTSNGMPLSLRSEVRDSNQSKWYKKMYDTIHKQKPYRDEFVTVRYKPRRAQYPYISGYLSEPEPGTYESDHMDYKYATLDRRRTPLNEKENFTTSTMPRNAQFKTTSSSDYSLGSKLNPGRIENYIPGRSSISEQESKKWWDEVMDIFDGKMEEDKKAISKGYMSQALKESGYESDSTLVFRKKEDGSHISPSEQKEAYKIIQKGGDVPLHGLRKPAPERPKENSFQPDSPSYKDSLYGIGMIPRQEIFCYPVTLHPKRTDVFSEYKRSAPTSVSVGAPRAPSPPKRRSSRNNTTLRLITTMKVEKEKLPVCKRHEICFTSSSEIDKSKVKYLREKITCKLSPTKSKRSSRSTANSPKKPSTSTNKTIVTTRSSSGDAKSVKKMKSEICCSKESKPCKICSNRSEAKTTKKLSAKPVGTFGTEKRKILMNLPKFFEEKKVKPKSEENPNIPRTDSSLPFSPSPHALRKTSDLNIKVNISNEGKRIFSRTRTPSPSQSRRCIVKSSSTPNVAPVKLSALNSSLESLKSPTLVRKERLSKIKSDPKIKIENSARSPNRANMKKSKKEEINGKIANKKTANKTKSVNKSSEQSTKNKSSCGSETINELENETLEEIRKRHKMVHSNSFFQSLFLRGVDIPAPKIRRKPWLYEQSLEKKRERPKDIATGAMKIYLNHTKPVSESKFKHFDSRPRSVSPKSITFGSKNNSLESIDRVGRSISLPPKLIYFSQTSRPVSPVVDRRQLEIHRNLHSPTISRSPSRRKIDAMKQSQQINTTKITKNSPISSESSALNQSRNCQADDCRRKDILNELTYLTRRSSKFKDLNEFYITLEKLGELERMASMNENKIRKKSEGEIVDFDRWREVHQKERTEKEMNQLFQKLKAKERDEGFLYRPKDVNNYRWNRELDRGLRTKEKSVDNIRGELEKLKLYDPSHMEKFSVTKDTYKPLWRGSSVLNLASHMVAKRSKSEGRVPDGYKKYSSSDKLLTEGIGSRIWSSLSMDQVNTLHKQLSEIYNPDTRKQKISPELSVFVPAEKSRPCHLTVRRNSDISKPLSDRKDVVTAEKSALSENEKKLISQSLSKEIMRKISKPSTSEPKCEKDIIKAKTLKYNKIQKEKKHQQIPKENEENKIVKLQEADKAKDKYRSSESGSTDESTNTVIFTGLKEDVKQKVNYFEKALDSEEYIPTIHKPAESELEDEKVDLPELGKLVSSSSCQDLKELFGEKEMMRMATHPLSSTRKSQYTSPPLQLRTTTMSPCKLSVSETTSCDSLYRSRSLSPFFDDPQSLMRSGEVRRLKDKFEFVHSYYTNSSFKLRRCFSDSNLYKRSSMLFPALLNVDVDSLKKKYEYPARAGRGRSRIKKGGVVSPVFLRAEDRFMPHINIISKIASLCSRKYDKVRSPTSDDLSEILSLKSGDVEKLREKFDKSGDISLLGKMFTSSPDIKELKDIAPYLTASWTAHRFPRTTENTIPLSSPSNSIASMDTSSVRKVSIKPRSPQRVHSKSSILKPHQRTRSVELPSKSKTSSGASSSSQPELNEVRYRSNWTSVNTKPSVTFKEPESPVPPAKSQKGQPKGNQEGSPRKYVENQVTIHYKTPVRQEVKDYFSEDELAHRQQEAMKKMYQEERRRKYLQELQDMHNRRHTDNFIPSQKSPIPLNRYDDFDELVIPQHRIRPRSPEPRLVAKALYNFVGMTPRELTFRKGDNIYVRRQIDKNWYEGELNAMVGLFPVNYVEIVPYDNVKSTTPARKPNEGQARAKYNFLAKTHLELSLAKGEMVIITKRVDNNWYEGKIGGRKGIFPASYVDVLIDPQEPPKENPKPVAAPAAHSLLLNGSSVRESMGSHTYTPNVPVQEQGQVSSYYAKPVQANYCSSYGGRKTAESNNPMNQALHIDTQSADPIPYRALYKYQPQNDDELELMEGDTVYVLEKCDDGWYVGSNERTGAFGTFPGNYVEKV